MSQSSTPSALLQAMRPHQWVKNGFVVAPLIFARKLTETASVTQAAMIFAGFSLVASSIYLINDSADVERDRSHPVKRNRPIASGAISVRFALLTALVLAAAGAGLTFTASSAALAVVGIYFVTNLLYSTWLKHVPLLDVFIIAFGFLLRVVAGAVGIGAGISPWLLICTFFVALFMAFGKRRGEIDALGAEAAKHRAALGDYGPDFLDQTLSALMAMTVMSYALYTIDRDVMHRLGTDALVLSVPLVLFGVLRYQMQIHRGQGGSPTRLVLRDRVLQFTVLLYVVVVTTAIYRGLQLGLLAAQP